ncbi:MAG TPA: glycoside hydrolase family 9 protein [Acidobacteriota bacterium]|nr:glycoside hydrolase family 9 protein [Acidobacteriota bacterium]
MLWLDDRDLAVTKEDPGVTALYAGLAAWLGALYQELDLGSEKPQEWIQEARSAYNWAKDHRAPAEELAFGAVGLYRATGQPSYQDDYRSNYSFSGEYWAGPEWPQQAACLYALLDDSHTDLDREFQDRIRTAIRSAADQYWVEPGLKRGYRATHIAPNQANMLGTFSTPRTLMQAVAYGLTGEQRYLDAVQFAADYTLGGNPMNLVWMSGLGHRPEIQPFHIDSWSLRVNAVAETLGCRRTTVADCLQVTDTFGAELERLEDYPEMHWSHVIRAARHPKALGGPAAAVQVFAQHLHGGHKPSVREYEAALRGNKPQGECQFRVFYCSKYQKVLESDRVCEDCPVMKGR